MAKIDESIYTLRKQGFSQVEIAENLGLNINFVKRRFQKRYQETLKRKQEKEEQNKLFENLVIEKLPLAHSMNNLCNLLGLKGVDGYYNKIIKIIKKYDLNTEHFTIWSSSNNQSRNKFTAMTDDEYFVNGICRSGTQTLKRLIDKGYKIYKCEECGIDTWNGKPLRLQVHHINGNHNDNRIENIQILCPNCHTQTDTYGRNNIPKKQINLDRNDNDINSKHCEVCGKLIKSKHAKYCSTECYNKAHLKWNAEAEEIINSFKELGSFVRVGRKYGVSDNAVRKRVKKLGIYDEIKKISHK